VRNPKKEKWIDCAPRGGSLQPKGNVGKRADGEWHAGSTNKRGHQHVKTRMRRSQKRSIRRRDKLRAFGEQCRRRCLDPWDLREVAS